MRQLKIIFSIIGVCICLFSLTPPPPSPPGKIGAYLNGVFPPFAPGNEGSWAIEDPMPDVFLPSPVRILPLPNTNDLLVLCKIGEIWKVNIENQTKELLLDIKDRVFKKVEGGSVGIALHPKFGNNNYPDKQVAFIFYRTKPDPDEWSELGFNRLSKFRYDPINGFFNPDSEEILFQQYDRSTWHNGGGMFFGPDEFLYLTLGDEGFEEHQKASTQRLDGGLFNGIIRIDVDNNPAISHPIRRQPLANENPPQNWGNTYSQGYSIPNDNPWLSPDSSGLEEFYAIGLRSPYSTYFDTVTQQIWVADVGSNKREEINIVEREDNLQWPYLEGGVPSEVHNKPDNHIGFEKSHYFTYERNFGSCVIGGGIYRGSVFPELNEKYLFADYTQNKIMALTINGSTAEPSFEILLNNFGGQAVDLPESPGITGVHPQRNGEVLITVTGEDFTEPSKILKLKRKTLYPDPPYKLSELNAFADLETLSPIDGILPYTVNSPLWSDGAVKERWIAIPNDGVFDSQEEQITFKDSSPWLFPEGTVFIKQFDLPTDLEDETKVTRIETRFFIVGPKGVGYGLTYKWDDDGKDASLLGGGTSKDFEITENGETVFIQTWDYPSRDQCITCHNDNTKYVLGVNTHQLNGELYYPHLGKTMNQLDFLKEISVFNTEIKPSSQYPKSHSLFDENASLEKRLRSYLDSNCSSCHQDGGVSKIDLDFRLSQPFSLQRVLNFPVQSQESTVNSVIVKPGDHTQSEIWVRDASNDNNKMPPLGRNLIDQEYVDSLAYWIDNIEENKINYHDLLLFPNPSDGWLGLKLNESWVPPFKIIIQSVSGKFIYQTTTEEYLLYLDLNQYPVGTYILKLDADNIQKTSKFVLY